MLTQLAAQRGTVCPGEPTVNSVCVGGAAGDVLNVSRTPVPPRRLTARLRAQLTAKLTANLTAKLTASLCHHGRESQSPNGCETTNTAGHRETEREREALSLTRVRREAVTPDCSRCGE